MTYIIDTHVFVWFLDKNSRLKKSHLQILNDEKNKLVFSTIVLAEIKHLIAIKRININFGKVLDHVSSIENCVIYPVDEQVVEEMPKGLNIHDALIGVHSHFVGNITGHFLLRR